MIQQEYTLESVGGGELFVKSWQPEANTKAVVVLVHGFGEHCSRYTPYVEIFGKENIAFVSFDQMGHGKSFGKRGCITSYQQLLDDVEIIAKKAEELFPEVPMFLYGHSMGGNIALNFLLQKKYPFKGGIISSPWLMLSKEKPDLMKNIVAQLQSTFPNFTVKSGLDINFISTIKKEVTAYHNDPLNHGKISFRLVHNITKQGIWAMDNTKQLKVPTLLIHGDADQITSPKATAIAAQNNPEMIEHVEFPGMYHEVHNDSARQDLAQKAIAFILKQL